MAQEIAGKVSPKRGERRSNLSVASTVRSDRRASVQTVASTIRPSKTLGNVTSPIEEEREDSDFGATVPDSVLTDLPQSVTTEDSLPVISLPSTSPPTKSAASESSASPPSQSPTAPLSPIKLKRRSKSTPQLHSILKRGESSGTASDAASPGSASTKSRPWARKAGRSVRVQSQRASKVEGDYAAFLKRASRAGGFGNTFNEMDLDAASDTDKQSVRSGRSVNSRYSGKSGIENGCFRRGSMSSIKTGRTIATVGGVSVKDMSRRV
jgi:hypothetical protein